MQPHRCRRVQEISAQEGSDAANKPVSKGIHGSSCYQNGTMHVWRMHTAHHGTTCSLAPKSAARTGQSGLCTRAKSATQTPAGTLYPRWSLCTSTCCFATDFPAQEGDQDERKQCCCANHSTTHVCSTVGSGRWQQEKPHTAVVNEHTAVYAHMTQETS